MPRHLYRFYLVEQTASGYVPIGHRVLMGFTGHSVKVIEDAARDLINERLDLHSTAGIKLDVYQPPKPFGDDTKAPFELLTELMKVFNDGYRDNCARISDGELDQIRHKEHLIVVVRTFEVQFFLFSHLSQPSTITYSGRDKVNVGAGQTVGVIEDAACKYIKDQTRSNLYVRIVRVAEPRRSTLNEHARKPRGLEDYDCIVNTDPGKVILRGTTTPLQKISAKDSLIIEFEQHQYLNFQFFLFGRSSKTTATYLGTGKAIAGVDQTVRVIEDAACKYIKDRTRSNMHVRIVRVAEPRRSTLNEYTGKPCGLEDYDCMVNTNPGKVILYGTTTPVQEISARDSLIIEFEQHQYLVFFEKAGPSYECLGSFRVLVPPNTDETVDEITKRTIRDLPGPGPCESFCVYQSKENHEKLETKPPTQVEVEIPLNDGYLNTNATLCTPQTSSQTLESNTLIIVIDDQGNGNCERLLEPVHEDLVIEATCKQDQPLSPEKPDDDSEVVRYAKWAAENEVERVCEGTMYDDCSNVATGVKIRGSFEYSCYLKCSDHASGDTTDIPDSYLW